MLTPASDRESGAVLLLMLLSLVLSGTSAVLALHGAAHTAVPGQGYEAVGRQGPAPSGFSVYMRAERDAYVLHQAKLALLAYAVAYADNYNPSGAGPGHLPCPDLDPPDDNNPRNDGPNPPCSRALRQTGRVPRLTTATRNLALTATAAVPDPELQSLPDNRTKVLEFYPLHTHLDQQPWYQVADGFINNPLNRRVNPSSRSTLSNQHSREMVALLIAPGAAIPASRQQRPGINARDYLEPPVLAVTSGAGNVQVSRDYSSASNDIVSPIYRDELMPLVQLRVAGFVSDSLLAFRDHHCPVAASINSGDPIDTLQSAPPVCFPFAAATDSDDVPDANDTAMAACTSGLHRGRLPIAIGNCSASLSTHGTLQGVENTRHWFIRNGWPAWFDYQVSADCVGDIGHRCKVVIDRQGSTRPADADASAPRMRISVVVPE